MIELLEFAGKHPILFLISLYIVCQSLVYMAQSIFGKSDSNKDEKKDGES